MRLSVAVLALSTLAAAGPLPPMSNTTIDLGVLAQVPANFSLKNIDPITTMNNLKAIYDYLNKTDHIAATVPGFKGGDFSTWLKYTFESPSPPPPPPSGLHARSPDPIQIQTPPSSPSNFTKRLNHDAAAPAAPAKFKPLYHNENESESHQSQQKNEQEGGNKNKNKEEEGVLLQKRASFWHWLKMAFEAPGLGSGTV